MNKWDHIGIALRTCFVLLFISCAKGMASVPLYQPRAINYTVADYQAGNQNWAISQGPDGKIYVGNNKGLLVFNGTHFELIQLPNKRGVRSLYITPESRIYVGSFEEFGYFEKDETGTYHYHSLSDASISPYFQNDDIWTIKEHQGEIYFQSFLDYYIYDGKSVRRGASPLPPKYLFASDDQLYIQLDNCNGFIDALIHCRIEMCL